MTVRPTNEPGVPQPKKPVGCGVWIIAIIAVLAVLGAMGVGNNDDSGDSSGGTSTDSSDQEFAAFDVCTTFVKRNLKSPSTAKFRNFFEDDSEVTVTGTGDGPYVVVSSVDSENGFGAQLRTGFICTVTKVGDRWHLDNLVVDE